MNLMRNNGRNQNTRSISAASKHSSIGVFQEEGRKKAIIGDVEALIDQSKLVKTRNRKGENSGESRRERGSESCTSVPRASSIEGVYLAFRVLRRLLLNTLSVTYSNGYMDTSSKLSMLASMPGGQKKPGLERRISAATISLVGVKPRATWRTPRPSRVVSAKGDSTRIVSESSQYSDSSSLRILLLCERAGNLVLCDALIDDLPRAAKRRLRSFRSGHLWILHD